MIHLSQRDPRWSFTKMLPSSLTIGRYGCTTTCISMLSDYFGDFYSPASVAQKKLQYTIAGLIIWTSIAFEKFRFGRRTYGWNTAEIDASIKDPNKAVILEVANGSHWVVAIRKVPFSKHYFIVDPWDGKVKTTLSYKNITGAAHFLRN